MDMQVSVPRATIVYGVDEPEHVVYRIEVLRRGDGHTCKSVSDRRYSKLREFSVALMSAECTSRKKCGAKSACSFPRRTLTEIGNSSPKFVRERRIQLEAFMRSLVGRALCMRHRGMVEEFVDGNTFGVIDSRSDTYLSSNGQELSHWRGRGTEQLSAYFDLQVQFPGCLCVMRRSPLGEVDIDMTLTTPQDTLARSVGPDTMAFERLLKAEFTGSSFPGAGVVAKRMGQLRAEPAPPMRKPPKQRMRDSKKELQNKSPLLHFADDLHADTHALLCDLWQVKKRERVRSSPTGTPRSASPSPVDPDALAMRVRAALDGPDGALVRECLESFPWGEDLCPPTRDAARDFGGMLIGRLTGRQPIRSGSYSSMSDGDTTVAGGSSVNTDKLGSRGSSICPPMSPTSASEPYTLRITPPAEADCCHSFASPSATGRSLTARSAASSCFCTGRSHSRFGLDSEADSACPDVSPATLPCGAAAAAGLGESPCSLMDDDDRLCICSLRLSRKQYMRAPTKGATLEDEPDMKEIRKRMKQRRPADADGGARPRRRGRRGGGGAPPVEAS